VAHRLLRPVHLSPVLALGAAVLLAALGTAPALAETPAASGAGPSLGSCPMRFAVIGDRTGGAVPGKYEQSLREIEGLRPDFAVTVGDMIEGYTSDTTELKQQWEHYMGLLGTLSMPVYFTPGNHDISDLSMLDLYKRYIGEPYHSFDVRGVHFVELDNGRYPFAGLFPKEQADWLAADLAAHRDAPLTFVFMHIPYWRETVARGNPDQLHRLFVEYGVDGVFTGHDHVYYSGKFDGVVYTDVGSSGAETEPGLTGLEYNFVWVTAGADGFTISPVKMGGVLPWDEVAIEDLQRAADLQAEAVVLSRVLVGTALEVADAPVEVTVKNVHDSMPIKSTLSWQVPQAWSVSPEGAEVDLRPASTGTYTFHVTCPSGIYPAPALSITYPYREGKTWDFTKSLPVARTASAFRAAKPPEIDGALDDAAWHDPVTAFFGPDGGPAGTDPTAFYFAWDPENLYVAARCEEKEMGSLAAGCAEQDCPVYAEDCVGFFLEPETDSGPVYQIYFSPGGTAFDQKISVKNGYSADSDPAWNGAYDVKTSRGPGWWAIEARIPLSELSGRAGVGTEWALNFRRKQHRLATSADWQVPIGYDPAVYGVLEFK
jgi:3',5'-cyclic AMP phosphodiesterase CpdA